MSRRSSLLFILVAVAATAVAAVATSRAPGPPVALASARVPAPCQAGPAVRLDGTPIAHGTVFMAANGAVRLLACRPSTLSFQADGTEAHGVYARLVVSEDGHQLADTQVKGTMSFSIPVPTPGWVLIAFPNDLYDPPADRNLRLSKIALRPSD